MPINLKETAAQLNKMLQDRGAENPNILADNLMDGMGEMFFDFSLNGYPYQLHVEVDTIQEGEYTVTFYNSNIMRLQRDIVAQDDHGFALAILKHLQDAGDFRFTRKVLNKANDKKYQDGTHLCVVSPVPKDISQKLTFGEGADDAHITVLYLGDVPKEQLGTVLKTIGMIFRGQKPIQAKLDDKVTYFEPTEQSDNKRVAKIEVIVPDLEPLHKKLWDTLEQQGVEVAHSFDEFKPHLTLAYIEPNTEYTSTIPTGPAASWPITTVELWGLDQHVEFNFTGPATMLANRVAARFMKGL